ncbi:MAG: hypothetical protein VW739_01830 [Pelagibacteraceae bacterium]
MSGVGSAGGGNVTFVTAPASGKTVVIRRESAQTQTTDYTPNDPFPAEAHEDALDKITFIAQEIQEELDRAIKISRTNTMTSTEFSVGASDRANKVLAFDSSGEIAVTQELGTYKGNWSASTAYYVRDLIKDTSNNNVYICNTAHTSSGAQPISTNTDSAKWTLIVDAAAASTSAAAAAASASAAATSESNAATSESNASSSASAAASSASSASSSASSASSSATAASNAQAAAEAALDTFTDQYLGAFSSDPTTDNDGDPLTDGDLYFDTNNNVMKVYDLGTTTWKQLTPTAGQQTNIDTVAGISGDVSTVAGISGDVTTVSGNTANINTVAGSISNVNTVGTNITSVVNAANSIASINNFGDTYFVSATAPSSPTLGDLWFDTANDIMKVYTSGGFANAGSSVNGTSNRYNYVVGTPSGTYTGSTTVFPATYDAGYVDVYLNGAKLVVTSDFTATNGTDITLISAAATSDVVDIVAYGTFTAATALSLGDNEKIQLGASQDLQIYHDASNSIINDAGTGNLQLQLGGSTKLEVQSTGVDVTGDLTVDTDTLYVDSTNNRVGVGTTSPDGRLHVYNASAGTITAHPNGDDLTVENNTESGISILSPDTSAGNIYFGSPSDTDNVRLFGYYNSGTPYMGIMTANSLRVRVDSDGLKFNSDTAAANALDDYEEGTWTPTYVSSGGGESVSYDVQKAGYIKIGRFVHFQLQLGTTSISGGSGYIQIGGLPFANDGGTNGANAVSIGLAYGFATTITGGSSVQVGTTELIFYKNDNAASVWPWSSLATGSSANRCWISGTYITA